MNLPPLDANRDEQREAAESVRSTFMEKLHAILAGPTLPVLTQEERDKVADKVLWLLQHENRASYWLHITYVVQPPVVNGVSRLCKLLLRWSGNQVLREYKEPTQKIGNAANGRVIKNSGGL